MTFTLPYPPTANLYWRHVGSKVLLSKEARAYRNEVAILAYRQATRNAYTGELRIFLDLFRPRRAGDLDNLFKQVLDALKGIAFNDDSQIVEIHARRYDDKARPRVEVRAEEMVPFEKIIAAESKTNGVGQ